MNFDLLSPNLVLIANALLKNQDLCNLIYYDVEEPLIQNPLEDSKVLFMDRVFPYPTSQILDNAQTQLRIWYPETTVANGLIEDTSIYFDIITHNSLYLMRDAEGRTTLRPYKIASQITSMFDGISLETVGRLYFIKTISIPSNDFQILRLIAKMMTLAG